MPLRGVAGRENEEVVHLLLNSNVGVSVKDDRRLGMTPMAFTHSFRRSRKAAPWFRFPGLSPAEM
jgi:hypothetical protein